MFKLKRKWRTAFFVDSFITGGAIALFAVVYIPIKELRSPDRFSSDSLLVTRICWVSFRNGDRGFDLRMKRTGL